MGAKANHPVLVAGAGIGGLGVAIALARRGIPVHVLEAEAEFGEVGAGLQIGPSAGRILASWGLWEAFSAAAAHPRSLVIRDGRNSRCLATVPLDDEFEQRYGAPYLTVERRVLYALLLNAARQMPGISVTASFRVSAVEGRGTPLKITSTDGRSLTGRALICADGVRSRLRTQMFGGAPTSSGMVAWRATAKLSEVPNLSDEQSVSLWLAPNAHLVLYLCGPTGPLNAVAVVDETAVPDGAAMNNAAALMAHFASWPKPARDILSHFSGWIKWPLMGRPPLDRWSQGAVTLLGDAAHPVLPFLASGAVLAIEDAEVLAVELAHSPDDPAGAFLRYEALRVPRANRVVAGSAQMGKIYHMDGIMRLARNAVLTVAPSKLLFTRNDWLYGFRVAE